MYHCHIRFYLIGAPNAVFNSIKNFMPLEHFTHTFLESEKPEAPKTACADVLFVDLRGMDAGMIQQILTMHRKKESEIILLADREPLLSFSDVLPEMEEDRKQLLSLPDVLSEIEDIWIMPFVDQELEFRFQKWQKNYKRKQAYKQEILEKDQAMEMLFTTLDCGVMCHSIDGTQVISVNQAALRLLGYESQEEMMSDGFDLVAQSVVDKKKLRKCINSLTKAGDSVNTEYLVQHKDGKKIHILGNVKLIEKNGRLYYQRFLLDYTAQKLKDEQKWTKKNQEIQYQEQVFEIFSTFLSDNVDDVYMMLDANRKQADFVSPNIERVLGIPWKTAMDDVAQIGSANYLERNKIRWEDMSSLEPGMSMETMETERIDQKTGERKWFRESLYCVLVQGIRKIVVYISDRTKEKKNENTLSEALNMAQMANKAKSAFLSSVGHDIRTPMNAIIGFIPLLQAEAGNPESVLEYTRKISGASRHLLGLIDDMLDLNKIESGCDVLHISELTLKGIIDEVNATIRPQTDTKKQTFEISTASITNKPLLGDKLRINQILINILSNAVKYTPGGGHIKLTAEELPPVNKDYCHIRFIVTDNGCGMSEEYQKVIFEPFNHEPNAMQNNMRGAGLGMAITKNLVDLMNGSIKVKSRLGEGTAFTVELPLCSPNRENEAKQFLQLPPFTDSPEAADRETADTKTKKDLSDEERNLLAGKHALVVDDNRVNQLILVKLLSTLGAECDVVEDGQQAVEKFVNNPADTYDIILMDLHMPVMNGYEATRIIRASAHPSARTIPIIAVSANAFANDIRNALDAGMDAHVAKPVVFEKFKEALQKVLIRHLPDTPAAYAE